MNALILVDVQKGFHHPTHWGVRNNPGAEKLIGILLDEWRRLSWPVIHIQHLSLEERSPLRPDQAGVDFLFLPLEGEKVIQKNVNSGFIQTPLEGHLKENGIGEITLVGFTTDHCVSTTARMGANLGFTVNVIADACITFNRYGLGEKSFPAEQVHELALASLNREFARIMNTREILGFENTY